MDRTKFDQVMKVFDKLYQDYKDCRIDSSERPLYFLLLEHRDDLPSLETIDDYGYFQKCFRQNDVISGNIDIAIWLLLDSSRMFWCACEEVFNNKNADDLYWDNWDKFKRSDIIKQKIRRDNRNKKQ